MAFQTILPRALAARGLTVETVPGWETRGSSVFSPGGAVCHWTAGPANSKTRPSLGVVTNGRPGLAGPLCNVYLDRNGIAVVVAAGRANHAGVGNWRGLSGNASVFGTEAESAGPTDWTAAQRVAYPKVNAAFCDIGGFGPEMVCGHSEWAGPRKVDINGYTMSEMRAAVAAILAGKTGPATEIPPVQEDDMRILRAPDTGNVYLDSGLSIDHIQMGTWNAAKAAGYPSSELLQVQINDLAARANERRARLVLEVARTVSGADIDEKALGQVVVAGLLPALVAAFAERSGLTREDVEQVVRGVFGDAAAQS